MNKKTVKKAPTAPRKTLRPSAAERDAQRKIELEMIAKLCTEHGYGLQKAKGDQFTISMTASKVDTMRKLVLLIPIDSGLARSMERIDKAKDKAKKLGLDTKMKKARA